MTSIVSKQPFRWKSIIPIIRWVIIILSIISPGMVVYHRWYLHNEFYDVFSKAWRSSIFFNILSLPTYFLIVIPLVLAIILLSVCLNWKKARIATNLELTLQRVPVDVNSERMHRALGNGILGIAGFLLIVVALASLLAQVIPGVELLGIVFLYWLGLSIRESGFLHWSYLKENFGWISGFVGLVLSVILLLQGWLENDMSRILSSSFLVILLLVVLTAWRRSIPVILWICLGAMVLTTWGINSWRYSVIGDEHEFYKFAIQLLNKPVSYLAHGFFNVAGVYGTHTSTVSIFQAGFMKVFGADNFGWRISNPVILSAAIFCFYFFLRNFVKSRLALIAAILLACSSYLMNFGKIGYDNPQAILMLTLTLWLSARAVSTLRPSAYALLGLVVGLCLYSYPAALYVLPLPLLFLIIFDFPRKKASLWRWTWCLGSFLIMVMPLLFQPLYFQGKLEGVFLSNHDAIQNLGIPRMIGTNLVYSFFSYLYSIEESHFVTSSHLDPFSAVFVPVGLGILLPALKRNKFVVFWLLSFVLMLFFAGASHGRVYPPNTRMFMLLPWWVTFAAFGITDIVEWLQGLFKGANFSNRFTGILLIGILAANLVQVNWVFPRRTAGLPNLEVLFLRLAHKIDNDPADPQPVYLFVTEENWGIDGIRLLQDLYQTPQSKKQLDRIYLTGEILTSDQIQLIQASNTVIIPQPWMKPEWQEGLKPVLSHAGKLPCEIKNTRDTQVKFTAYFPAGWIGLCPAGGEWGE